MKPLVTMREAFGDPTLLGGALRGDSWHVWRVLLIAAVGEELTEDERAVFRRFTGRDREPGAMVDTWLTVSGRRSGKTTAMAALVVYLACLCEWSEDLSLGERGTALYLAPKQDQASRAFRYARTFVQHSPLMRRLIVNEVADAIELSNGIDIEVQAASWRHVRGATCVATVLDECAFFRSEAESANRDEDLVTALRPSLVTTGGPMLLISSPGTDVGVVHAIHRRHYGPQGDPLVLVVQSDSRSLNPKLDQARIDREYVEDPESAQADLATPLRAKVGAPLFNAMCEIAPLSDS
jgi:Terminase large subunit, T4likevirus-type, N-terminal